MIFLQTDDDIAQDSRCTLSLQIPRTTPACRVKLIVSAVRIDPIIVRAAIIIWSCTRTSVTQLVLRTLTRPKIIIARRATRAAKLATVPARHSASDVDQGYIPSTVTTYLIKFINLLLMFSLILIFSFLI